MTQVGVRALKDHLSEYLRRVGRGERIVVTDRGAPLATLVPADESEDARWAWSLVRKGGGSWSGSKPRPRAKVPALKGKKTTSEMVLEDRG